MPVLGDATFRDRFDHRAPGLSPVPAVGEATPFDKGSELGKGMCQVGRIYTGRLEVLDARSISQISAIRERDEQPGRRGVLPFSGPLTHLPYPQVEVRHVVREDA